MAVVLWWVCRRVGRCGQGCRARRSAWGGLQSLLLISVLVTEIQQRRVCGAGGVLSAQGLGLAGSL
ncbi:hypothetical protein GOB46_21590 [Sinorhizobium meliloti]|nr:hypothetical protein [Sinorhizobium meliloti]MDW9483107.1 hypothetical protein [Sinorhizobium meliloti]MDW9512490.1 hypothetical protein [Sinorhizobium meliloti]MDW9667839.1 hypothetical protein [Sinorhizobium meliloti]MDW9810023.1 hypothetical protein [Sinorhizobium meliloti]